MDPDTTYVWPVRVSVDGDWLIATGRKHLADEPLMQVDMDGGVAVFIREGRSWIFERSDTNWKQVPSPIGTDGMDVEVHAGTIVVTTGACSWSSAAYRKGSNGAWALVRSTPPSGEPAICENEDTRGDVGVSGSAIIVATFSDENPNSARIFEGAFGTPATEATIVGTFEHPIGGPFTVATTSTSRVFRQLSDTGNSAATLNGTDWTNEAVVADIKPTLGSANLPVTLNRSYRVRLEVIGTRLRLYIDDQLLAEASDSSLLHGLAGVMMFRTKADYDNVVVSANPQTAAQYDYVIAVQP